eukprot:SM000018S03557  [mRNA]  locus=s18:57154:57815:+ [translate_table: standard]
MASPASVGFSRTDGYAWANRPDLVKPHASRIEQAAAVLKVYPVLAAQRVHAMEEYEWPLLAGLGHNGQVVLRAETITDERVAVLAALIENGSRGMPPPAPGQPWLPSIRTTAWGGATGIAFIIPALCTTAGERAAFAANGWRALLPESLTYERICAALYSYVA